MTQPSEIPYLVKLLDDESSDVQKRIKKELLSFGPNLKSELQKLSITLTPSQAEQISLILAENKKAWLKQNWPIWFYIKNDYEKLEKALGLLSGYLNESDPKAPLNELLDALAESYRLKFKITDARLLAQFLFKEKAFAGNEGDYYNPQNSNLTYVIEKKKGIPISLACLYMLVGHRLGLKIDGCHYPGHFLARIDHQGKKVFVDCFSHGQLIEETDIVRVRDVDLEGIEEILHERVDAESIIRRFLANLIRAFQLQENEFQGSFMIELFKDLDIRLTEKELAELSPDDIIHEHRPAFASGQVVRHKRYGYRGIIVDVDLNCKASDQWYYSNQSHPRRNQPWFHILVHGTDQVTYVAQANILEDSSSEQITHPLLSYFFTKNKDGIYIRNDNPWPGTDF